MRLTKLFKTKLALLAVFLVGSGLAFVTHTPEAQAAAAFARQTGMSCTHCHTVRGPSQTAIGKMFFIQGYRMQSLWGEIRHGEPYAMGTGKEGGSFWLAESPTMYLWWRTRMIPWVKKSGDAFTDIQEKAYAALPSRWALGLGGPIGDYIGIWNEEYFQPYAERFVGCSGASPNITCNRDDHQWTSTGGNGPEYPPLNGVDYHYRFSHVEVDELDVQFQKEVGWLPPTNVVGMAVTNRGRRVPNSRGGSAITSAVGPGDSSSNGSVQLFGYNGEALLLNFTTTVGDDVSWEKRDYILTVYYWPWRNNQRDLSFDFWWTEANDAGPVVGNNPLGHANIDKGDNHSFNLRTNYVAADVGPHMLDFEINVGYGMSEMNSSDGKVEFTQFSIDPGIRYFYNRTYGFQLTPSLPNLIREQKVLGKTYKYKNKTTWSGEFWYAMQPNALWYFSWAQQGGGIYCPSCTPATQAPPRGMSYTILFELNY